jgi:HlyD family secretion protein
MKQIISLVGLGLVVILAVFLFRQCGRDDLGEYQTVTVTRGSITQAVTATGTLNPVVNVQVGSQISGNIEKLLVDFNSPVKAGQVVAQIDPAVFQAAVLQAQGDLDNAKAALEFAEVTQKRMVELVEKQNSSQSELDQANAALHQAQANVKIKEGALQKAKVDLEHCTITSPIDGIVISRSVDVGQTVAASLSAPVIFTIANDLAKMQIDAAVAEADIGTVDVGQKVEFTVDAFPRRIFHGDVVQVRNAPTTVQNVVTYDTVIGVNNADLKLKPGMTANLSIVGAQRDDVLKISNAALRFRPPAATPPPPPTGGTGGRPPMRKPGDLQTERTVYVLRSSKPTAVQIKTGISDGITTEVLDGLKEGDRVITAMVGKAAAQSTNNPLAGGQRRF